MLDHESVVRRELVLAGLRLDTVGTESFSWADFIAFMEAAPMGSALHGIRLENPEDAGWSMDSLLLATIADALHIMIWQNGEGRRRDRPDPIERPGCRPERTIHGKGSSMDPFELDALLGFDMGITWE